MPEPLKPCQTPEEFALARDLAIRFAASKGILIMGWSIGFDSNWQRDIGYGVPCTCDHPDCNEEIDRGLAYVCGGDVCGGDDGCGLFFCGNHLLLGVDGKEHQVCERCAKGADPYEPKPDVRVWIEHKLTCPTWQQWRDENPSEVANMEASIPTESTNE